MAGLDPAIPLRMARPYLTIGIAGSSPAMTAEKIHLTPNMLYRSRISCWRILGSGSVPR